MHVREFANCRTCRSLCALSLVAITLAGCGGAPSTTPAPTADPASTEQASLPTLLPTPFTLVTPVDTPTPVPPTVVPPTPSVELHQLSDASWAMDLLLDDESGIYGVVMMQPDGSINYVHNSHLPFVSASLYKLVLLADIFRKIEDGSLSLEDEITIDPATGDDKEDFMAFDEPTPVTIERALFATGAFSSNIAAAELMELTDLNSLAQTAAMIGMYQTQLQATGEHLYNWPPPVLEDSTDEQTEQAIDTAAEAVGTEPTSLTTPMDMAIYLQKMHAGTLITPFISDSVKEILLQSAINDRIPELLPDGTTTAHKTGNLDFIIHDVGTIETPDGTVILAALSENVPNEERARQIIQRLALIAYGEYDVPPFKGAALATPESDSSPESDD